MLIPLPTYLPFLPILFLLSFQNLKNFPTTCILPSLYMKDQRMEKDMAVYLFSIYIYIYTNYLHPEPTIRNRHFNSRKGAGRLALARSKRKSTFLGLGLTCYESMYVCMLLLLYKLVNERRTYLPYKPDIEQNDMLLWWDIYLTYSDCLSPESLK